MMRLHHLIFAGPLATATEHLNANGLAPFDIVAMRSLKTNGAWQTEVVIRVPPAFDEATWGQADEDARREIRARAYEEAKRYRAGQTTGAR